MSDSSSYVLQLLNISKQFGVTRALDHASFRVKPASVHGLVGENGAGKSTLIKILAGIHSADSGEVIFHDQAISRLDPSVVESLGIHFIHQDRLLPGTLTVGEALFLGHEHTWFGLLNRKKMAREAEAYLKQYFDIHLSGYSLIQDLSTAEQQIVQITRALLANPKLIVFDEPTASLIKREVDQLQRLILKLKEKGIAVIYISHYLQEIEALCDEVTIFRNGKDVGTVNPKEVNAAEIARLMINREVNEMYPKENVSLGDVVLDVQQLSLPGHFQDVSFQVRKGEILGITGLVGSGVKAVVETLFGLKSAASGSIKIHNQVKKIHSPHDAVKAGIGLVPEDRRKHGIATELTVLENTTLSNLKKFANYGWLSRKKETAATDEKIQSLRIKTSSDQAYLRQLSGGNQQKVAIAKWLETDADIYIFDEPAVGVDVGAKVEIYRLIGELVKNGAAVIILSSDLQELVSLTDSIAVFYRGELIQTLRSIETNTDEVLATATGAGRQTPKQIIPQPFKEVKNYVNA